MIPGIDWLARCRCPLYTHAVQFIESTTIDYITRAQITIEPTASPAISYTPLSTAQRRGAVFSSSASKRETCTSHQIRLQYKGRLSILPSNCVERTWYSDYAIERMKQVEEMF